MLIVPFAKTINWKRPPIVTIALVIINVLVFSFWQAGDDARYQTAIHQYLHSSLPKIEFPRYESFLHQHQRNADAADIAEMRRHPDAGPAILWQLQHDAPFLRAMAHGKIVKKNEAVYARWQKDRQAFETKFNAIVDESHTFKPAFPELSDAFTAMFLHGGIMHLVGNMVFLLIVGLVVERLIGSGLYLVAYLSGGLISLAFFVAGNSDSAVPLLGASGAISAIMGMYAALFGTRKIPFFYSLGFYFDTIRAPAWILLLAWLGKEAYALLTDDASHVAYLAHFGGLLGGGVMGYLATRLRLIDPADLEIEGEQEQAPPWQEEYNRGMALLGRMETARAAEVFARLQRQYPDEADILLQYYKSAKYQPESEAYHQSAQALFAGDGLRLFSAEQLRQLFNEYLQQAKPKPRLNREMLHRLGAYFLTHGCVDEARRVAMVLIRHDGASERTAGLAVRLARQLRLTQQLDEAVKLLQWVLHQHGGSAVAAQARTMLHAATEPEQGR